MYYWVLIAAIVFFILILPLPLRFQVYFNKAQKRLYYSIILFNVIYVYSGYLRLVNGRLLQTNFLGRSSFLNLVDMPKGGGMPKIGLSIFRHATFTKFNLFFEVGKSGDAFYPVMMSGLLRAILGAVYTVIREKNRIIDLNNYVITKTDKDTFEASADSIFKVSLFGVLYAVTKDLLKLIFEKEKEKKQNV